MFVPTFFLLLGVILLTSSYRRRDEALSETRVNAWSTTLAGLGILVAVFAFGVDDTLAVRKSVQALVLIVLCHSFLHDRWRSKPKPEKDNISR